MDTKTQLTSLSASLLLSFQFTPLSSEAGGFRLPDASTVGMSMGNAVIANPEESSAIPYNPAIMAFQKHGNATIGGAILDHETRVNRTGLGTTASTGKTPVAIPYLQISNHLNDKWSVGLNINAPFGLETNWAPGTFTNSDPTLTRVAMVNLNPNVAYRVSKTTALSAGLAHYNVTDATQNTATAQVVGKGEATGYQLGLIHVQDDWSVGLGYRSAVSVPLTGAVNGALPILLDLDLPWFIQAGVRLKVSPKWNVEFDVERVGWGSFKETRITTLTQALVSLNTNAWHDTNTYRLGVSYDKSKDTRLYAGYIYDTNPVPDEHFSARLPSSDFQAVSTGFSHRIGNLKLQAAYQYFFFDKRTTNSNVAFGTNGTDANGTDDYNGNFETDVQQISFSVSLDFD